MLVFRKILRTYEMNDTINNTNIVIFRIKEKSKNRFHNAKKVNKNKIGRKTERKRIYTLKEY